MRKYSLLCVSWLFVFIWFQDLPLHTGQPIIGSSWGRSYLSFFQQTSVAFSSLSRVMILGDFSPSASTCLLILPLFRSCLCSCFYERLFCRRRFDILALLILLSLPICSLSHICEGHDVNVSTGARAPHFIH